ncbi:MAG: glycosyltransferase family 2 protein [Bacteroidota bacterium]
MSAPPQDAHDGLLFELIIPTYNNLPGLQRTLEALERQTLRQFRVHICVDGSTDGTFEWLEEQTFNFAHQVHHHPNRANRGRNATRNLALPHLEAEFLALIDSDLVPVDDWLAAHLEMLCAHNGWCASGGAMHFTDAHTNAWARYYMTRGRMKYAHAEQAPFQYFTTGNIALPTRCFVALGGQDAEMRTYGGGDTEFAYRLHKHFQLPLYMNHQASASGVMGKSLAKVWQQMEEMGQLNLRHIRQKHPEFTEVYRVDLLLGSSLKARLIQLALSRPFERIVSMLLPVSGGWLERRLIHYKTLFHLRKGYLSATKKPD